MFDLHAKKSRGRIGSTLGSRALLGVGAALIGLGAASSAFAQTSCPVTFAINNAATPEAVQFEVAITPAAAAQGDFTACSVIPSGILDFNTDGNTLELGWATDSVAFAGPGDFAVCTFTGPGAVTVLPADFSSIALLDCTESANPVTPCAPAPTFAVAIGTCSVCGNGTVEPGEQCETTDPRCNPDCTLAGNCTDQPVLGCKVSAAVAKSKLQLKDNVADPLDNTKDSGQYQWKSGALTDVSEFKDPVNTAGVDYRLCVYDADGLVAAHEVPSQGTCDGKPCWKASGSTGFQYGNKNGAVDGISQVKLKAGDAGKSSVSMKLKSKTGEFVSPPLPLTVPSVRAQLIVDDGVTPVCFETTLAAPTKNEPKQYSAKGP
jgi:hypothetical protein